MNHNPDQAEPLLDAKVVRKSAVADDIAAITFEVPVGLDHVRCTPGAHIDVHLPSGAVRQYSLTGLDDPGTNQLTIAVLREADGRGGSIELVDTIEVGTVLKMSAPRNHFELDEGAQNYRLLAGGIGLTPLLSMAIALESSGKSFTLDICAKKRSAIPFLDCLERAQIAEKTNLHLSREADSHRLDLARYISGISSGEQLYVCGPTPLIEEVKRLTQSWSTSRVRFEQFSNEIEELASDEQGAFEVELARTKRTVTIPADRSILDVLTEIGVTPESSCLEGVCGTCIADVVEGDVIHRDACLYEEEKQANSAIALCVSRARPGNRIVIDL